MDGLTEKSRADHPVEPEPFKQVAPTRVSSSGAPPRDEISFVASEELITVNVDEVGEYSLMCTPTDLNAIAAGFVFTEGLITSSDDIELLWQCHEEPGIIRMRIKDPSAAQGRKRNLIVATSCGYCGGSQAKESLFSGLGKVEERLQLAPIQLKAAQEELSSRQGLFKKTGGTHAAGLFDSKGDFFSFAEDIGRHSALDKAIGKALLEGKEMKGTAAALSGRISLELVSKCARAGIEVMAAVSAPTSMALEAAERSGITICGFVRSDRATVYTNPKRILLS